MRLRDVTNLGIYQFTCTARIQRSRNSVYRNINLVHLYHSGPSAYPIIFSLREGRLRRALDKKKNHVSDTIARENSPRVFHLPRRRRISLSNG